MSSTLPVRKLVLYKHGVATVTRQGRAEGQEVSVHFGAGELDDALKSLTVWTLDTSQVHSIHYATPSSSDGLDASIPLQLGLDDAFFGLLRGLRGIAVTLRLEGAKTLHGRVVGVEEHPQGRKHSAMLVLMTDSSAVEQIATDRVVGMKIDDERASRDLTRYLDVATSGGEQRTVNIALTQPDSELQLSYTIPSPVWRVSYRLIADSNAATCLLQGWAIFDNRFDEDIEDVDVSLVAGQPVSFRYDLTSSVVPQRRFVQDEARIVAGPVEFETMTRDESISAAATVFDNTPEFDKSASARAQSTPATRALYSSADVRYTVDSTQVLTEGADLAELFEYRVGKLSVGRGDSAMVPVVQHRGEYRRELLYNGDKHPGHPVVSMRTRNDTGLTLERGPATILEDEQYRGEAIVPFTKEGSDLVLAYAVELGIKVVERSDMTQWTAGIELEGAFLHVQEYVVRTTTYTIANDTAEEQVVTVERSTWGDLHDTRDPDEQSAEHRRWRVQCSPRSATTFVVAERVLQSRHEHIADTSMYALAQYLEENSLDAAARRTLTDVLLLRQTISEIDVRLQTLREEQEALAARQERLRLNLSIQATSEEEAEIRRRSSEDFRRTQDGEDEILAETQRLRANRSQAEADLDQEIAQL